jgi:type VI secretion system protein VasD
MTVRSIGGCLLLAAALGGLAGCGGAKPPPPPVLDLTVTGSADQNPSSDGKPRPVSIHLYQLAATQKFANADVFALVEHEKATLGQDDLDSSEIILKPSEKQEIKQALKAGTEALGVVAFFYDIDNAKWRASAPVAASGPSTLVLNVEKLSVSLKPAGK